VVDVGDDGDVADGAGHGGAISLPGSNSWFRFLFRDLEGVPPPPSRTGRPAAKSRDDINLQPFPRAKFVFRKNLAVKSSFHRV
jgi:hypothetical protein